MSNRREHLDARDVGISPAAATALAPFLDGPEPVFTRHFVLSKGPKTPAWEPSRTACGIDGIEPNTVKGTTSEDAVSCTDCKKLVAERQAREDKRALDRVRKAPVLVRDMKVRVRHRLVDAGLVKVVGNLVATVAEPKKEVA